jgi:hypothetical protein
MSIITTRIYRTNYFYFKIKTEIILVIYAIYKLFFITDLIYYNSIFMSIIKTIEDLRLALNEHNYNYYVLDNPTISDYDFDLKQKSFKN